MIPLRAPFFVALATATLACSSTVSSSDPEPSGSGDSGGLGPGGDATTFEASMGPITVKPGGEKTQCITMKLANPEGAFVRRFRAELSEGSHHMIVYRSTAQSELTTPSNCVGFSGILQGDHPIFIAQQPTSELTLPTDAGRPVGIQIDAAQMLRIEIHYLNASPSPIEVTGKVMLDTVPISTDIIRSDFGFWGTTKFSIPPNNAYATEVLHQPALPDTKSFALTTHQHHLGTRMRIWYASSAADIEGAPVADSTSWADPPLELFEPALEFPGGAGSQSPMGFAFQCEWENTTPYTVTFGEGFNDEMCFLWHYYYPSLGFHYCADGLCKALP